MIDDFLRNPKFSYTRNADEFKTIEIKTDINGEK